MPAFKAFPALPLLLILLVAIVPGCGAPATRANDPDAVEPAPPTDLLQARLDDTLESVYQHRSLSLDRNAAWQILHGVLAYRQEFLVEKGDNTKVPTVAHLLDGGEMRGWDVRPGLMFDNGRQGLRVEMEVGSKAGQGHPDQWFAILAQCGLPPDAPVKAGDKTYAVSDMLNQIQYEAPRNATSEYSWTLIGVTTYLPTTATWQAIDGREWSVERLVEIELGQELHSSACGGTHRLIGLAMARNRRLIDQAPMEGVWQRTQELLAESIETARQLQNPDGSFSTRYLARPSTSPDLAQNLGATGHVLEFLTVALPQDRLEEPWVRRSVSYLCDLLERTKELPLECGALYHAVHGLVLYRERVYGPRSYRQPPESDAPIASES